jgi:hypothetical protein
MTRLPDIQDDFITPQPRVNFDVIFDAAARFALRESAQAQSLRQKLSGLAIL